MDCDSERIWKMVDKYTPKERNQKRPESQNLFDCLYNCYIEHCLICPDKRFRSAVNLLQKLPSETVIITLIVSLYSDEDGYSLMLCSNGQATEQKEIFLPYEDDEIFSYLDAGEIPPVLLEILEKTEYCHLYNGCVVCEVRNYRQPQSQGDENSYDSTLLLLKPTQETILGYVNKIAKEKGCTQEEKLTIESKVLLATQPPLCLDPEIDVVCVQNRLHYNRRKFHSYSIKRYLRRQCQARRARMQLYSQGLGPNNLWLHSFLIQQREKRDSVTKITSAPVNVKRSKMNLSTPPAIDELVQDVAKYAKSFQSDVIALLQPRSEVPLPSQSPTGISSDVPRKNVVGNEFLRVTASASVPSLTPPKIQSSLPRSHSQATSSPPLSNQPITAPGKVPTTVPAHSTFRKPINTQTPSIQNIMFKPRTLAPAGSQPNFGSGAKTSTVYVQPMPSIAGKPRMPTIQVIVSSHNQPTGVSLVRMPGTRPSPPKAPPKLFPPNIPSISPNAQTANMPKLKPLEHHKLTPPPMSMSGPPPLSSSTIPTPPIKQATPPLLKTSPVATNTPAMPQLHKLQIPTSSPSSLNSPATFLEKK